MYNFDMNLNAKELFKLLLAKEDLTQVKLCKMLSDKRGKKYEQSSFSRKLAQGTITYNEVVSIIEFLGYELELKQKDKN